MQNISLRSSGMRRKQNLGFKVTQQSWLLLFAFSPPFFFRFSRLIFFSLAGRLVGFILVGRVFRKAFRILGLGERKGRWAMEQDFHGGFQVNVKHIFHVHACSFIWVCKLQQFKYVTLFGKRGIKVNLENNILTRLIAFIEKHGNAFCMHLNRFLMRLNNRLCCTSILHFVCWKVS